MPTVSFQMKVIFIRCQKRGFYVSDIDMVANPNTSAKTSADANLFDDSASITCSPYFADFSSNQTDSEIFSIYYLDEDCAKCVKR